MATNFIMTRPQLANLGPFRRSGHPFLPEVSCFLFGGSALLAVNKKKALIASSSLNYSYLVNDIFFSPVIYLTRDFYFPCVAATVPI